MYRDPRYASGMAQAVSVRLDDEALQALGRLEATGLNRSECQHRLKVDPLAPAEN